MSKRGSGHHAPDLVRRPGRIVPVVVVATILLLAGIAAVLIGATRLATGTLPSWASFLSGQYRSAAWDSVWGWVGFGIACLVALLCLIPIFTRGDRSGLRLEPGQGLRHGDREVVIDNSDLAGWIERWLDAEDGVQSVHVRREGRRLVARVSGTVSDPQVLHSRLDEQANQRVKALGPADPMTVKVKVS